MLNLDFNSQQMFYEVDELRYDNELTDVIKTCIEAQKKAGEDKLKSYFKVNEQAEYDVSKEALDKILHAHKDISDIRTNTDITNCLVFHTTNLDGSLIDNRLLELRSRTDEFMFARIREIFADDSISVEVSGHFWYPPGGYMGWHTNLRKPGWRMYVNYAEQEGKSYFRYRDPDTQAIVTCPDKQWNFRLFRIIPDKPFWHAVYSNTNRFSIGYLIKKADS